MPQFVAELKITAQNEKSEIANSSSTIAAIVEILNNIAEISTAVNESVVQVGCLSLRTETLHRTFLSPIYLNMKVWPICKEYSNKYTNFYVVVF